MKNILTLIIIVGLLLAAGCAAPAEQIIAIDVSDTPQPAITPVPTAEPVVTPAAFSASTPSIFTPIPTSAPTAKPTASPAPEATAAASSTAAPTPQPTAEPTPEPTSEPSPSPIADPAESADASDFGSGVLSLVNSHRSAAGLSSLKYSSSMQKAADTRAKECASSFSHTRPDGSRAYTALTERGLTFTAFGENLFAAMGMDSVSAEFAVEQWMASPGHRDNIMKAEFTHMCIGVAYKGDEVYVVQLFGAGIS